MLRLLRQLLLFGGKRNNDWVFSEYNLNSGITRNFTISNIDDALTLAKMIQIPVIGDWIMVFQNDTAQIEDLLIPNNFTIVRISNTLAQTSKITFKEIQYNSHFFRGNSELYIVGRGSLVIQ